MREFRDARQFKAVVQNYAKAHNIQNNQIGVLWKEIVLDDLLERISLSKYRNNFILKGGFLLSSIVGISNRSTEDIDTEIKGFDLTKEQIIEIFKEICTIMLNPQDPLMIQLTDCHKIHENGTYIGYRLYFDAIAFQKLRFNIKVDVSTGDKITPREIKFKHHLILEDRDINILAYNVETIVPEKLETVLTRSIANTRLKDFFDLYILLKQNETVDFSILARAFNNTCKYRKVQYYRNGKIDFDYCNSTIKLIENNPKMNMLWDSYTKSYSFAKGIRFNDTIVATQYWLNQILKNE
ncbi:nucleotidyl transferase AbiEii/AbiGii toxin family protein [Lactobacillus kefiranofaciens subsp. kefirgranum]|uniref:nucleotidyl transferase AbiEii/AbiGii toxin family protein n=1 Tax=Lactobacillus kefiranofaciens TaxID=267818 RepID=UPI00202F5835|nr:nucleotidyl transferase AbiEii/AbiGii toxin family protein [Lactobacillus kefiranofaciens]URW71176.1 nucleotidyl transferase AbiEii/AbiGii toxin family protein [Lactobacillus kefiranofaciens subsp. kefirgranum]URW73123.1 nucleotidyl transferase AbiEii/AbiGii toxin family protein [Lactobacillus kefiranofaciens subsp. kefirgranum]